MTSRASAVMTLLEVNRDNLFFATWWLINSQSFLDDAIGLKLVYFATPSPTRTWVIVLHSVLFCWMYNITCFVVSNGPLHSVYGWILQILRSMCYSYTKMIIQWSFNYDNGPASKSFCQQQNCDLMVLLAAKLTHWGRVTQICVAGNIGHH